MTYVRATQFPASHDDGAASGTGPTMIDGLEVEDDQVVVLAPLDTAERQPRRRRHGLG